MAHFYYSNTKTGATRPGETKQGYLTAYVQWRNVARDGIRPEYKKALVYIVI